MKNGVGISGKRFSIFLQSYSQQSKIIFYTSFPSLLKTGQSIYLKHHFKNTAQLISLFLQIGGDFQFYLCLK